MSEKCGHQYLRVHYSRVMEWSALYNCEGMIDATPEDHTLNADVLCAVCGVWIVNADDLPLWATDNFKHLFVTGQPPVAPIAPVPTARVEDVSLDAPGAGSDTGRNG